MGPPTLVTGVVTMGQGDGDHDAWVVRYRVSYSNDSRVWFYYHDSTKYSANVQNSFFLSGSYIVMLSVNQYRNAYCNYRTALNR